MNPKIFFFFLFFFLLLLLYYRSIHVCHQQIPPNAQDERLKGKPTSPNPQKKVRKETNRQMNKTSFPFLSPLLSQRSHFNSFPIHKTQIFSPYKPRREKPILELNPLSSKQSWDQNCNKTHDSTHNIPLPPPAPPRPHPLFLLPLSTCSLCDQSIDFSQGMHTCSHVYMLVNWYLLITFPWANNV
jgi:hypothetical protein